MCGIAGIIDFKGKPINKETLQRMASVLKHRGPDGEGFHYYTNGPFSVGLAHRRLNIIDLTENAKQPMPNEDGTLWLVFNGEIYNFRELRDELIKKGHVFKSATDAESLIHLYEEYGEDCLDYIRGMFAFCILDERKNLLFLARDRVGKKPLVYFYNGELLIFASEIKAILEDKRVEKQLDFRSVADFFTYGYIPSPKAIFKKIFKVPPAHKLIVKQGRLDLKRYWRPNYGDKIYLRKDSDYEEKIAELFDEAVKLRLASDVPLGIFLSGGIDSNTVLSFMAGNLKEPVKSFSIGFEDNAYNELKYAASMAAKYNTQHKEFLVKVDAVKILPRLVWFYNEPFGDSSCIPTYYVSQMTRTGVTVALCGDGGDEAFGGYNRYIAFRYLGIENDVLRSLLCGLLKFSKITKPLVRERKYNDYISRLQEAVTRSNNVLEQYLFVMGMFPTLNIFTEKFFDNLKDYDNKAYFENAYSTLTSRDKREFSMNLDFITSLPEDLMVKADIAAMANSLEVRSPFLDHKLLEFTSSIPFDKKVGFFKTKIILRNYLKRKGLLTKEVLNRKKQGFAVPIGEWFKKDLSVYLDNMVSESALIKEGFINRKSIDLLIQEHRTGARDHTHRLWCILNFELWYKIFMEGVSPESLTRKQCAV